MNRSKRIAAAIISAGAVAVLAACGDSGPGDESSMAAVMCENIINRQMGVEFEHWGPMDGATVTREGDTQVYVSHSATVHPVTRAVTEYDCRIENEGDGNWRMLELKPK